MQQPMDFALMVEKFDKKINNVRYEEVSMPQYIMVSTKVNLPSEVFISSHTQVILYGVRPAQVNLEYFTPLITPLLPSSIPSRSLDTTSNIEDVDLKSKFINMRQKLLDTMKEAMHQQFVTISEQMLCMMQNKLLYRPPSQESDHVQTGY